MECIANVAPAPSTASLNRDADFASAVESAKLQALYNFAYGLSHEINNPLANIATRAQTLLVDEKDPQRRRKLATIVQQAFRAHEMIADLMLFARPPTPRLQATDLVKLCETVVGEMQEQAREQETQLVHICNDRPLVACVDPMQIAVALKALVQNSLEALKHGGRIEVSAERGTGSAEQIIPAPHFAQAPADTPGSADPRDRGCPGAPHCFVTVADTGPGIPPETRPHIFDPFFSGREAGRGLGLGLSKAWRIVELHSGHIDVTSEVGVGARFTMVLPAAC